MGIMEVVSEKLGDVTLDGKKIVDVVKGWYETDQELQANIAEIKAMRKQQEEEDKRRKEEKQRRKEILQGGKANLNTLRQTFREDL